VGRNLHGETEGIGGRPVVYYIAMVVLLVGQTASIIQGAAGRTGYLIMEIVTLSLFVLLVGAALARWLRLPTAMIAMVYVSVANIVFSIHYFGYGGRGSSETLLLFSMILLSYTTLSGLVMGKYNAIILALLTLANAVAATALHGAAYVGQNLPVFATIILGNAAVVFVLRRSQESLMVTLRNANAALSEQTRELERVRSLAEMKRDQTEARYQAIVQDQTDLICRFDPDGTISFANNAFCSYFKCPEREMAADKRDFIATITGKSNGDPQLRTLLFSVPHGEEVATAEQCVQHLEGEQRWVRWISRPILDEMGTLVEYQAVGSDVTDMRKAYDELAQAKERADTANKAKSAFLANISHEIRNPLNGITGLAELLVEADDETRIEYAAQIRESARTVTELISEILDVSRVEAGRTTLRRRPVRIDQLITTTAALFRPEAEAKGLELSVRVVPDLPLLLVDPLRIRQMLYNLVGNAIKYTPSGSVTIEVTVDDGGHAGSPGAPKAGDDGSTWVPSHAQGTEPVGRRHRLAISIHDTGVGIPEKDQHQLFETFTRGSETHHYDTPGVGLGLAITRRLAELMEGSVSFSSREGVGSTFRVHLPCTEAPATPSDESLRAESSSNEPVLHPTGLTPRRIIIGEDNDVNRRIMKRRLELAGHTVTAVAHGGAVLEALERGAADVILVDVRMPVCDGVETTRRIRSRDDEMADIPVVAVTGFASAEEESDFLSAGITRVVSKPIEYEELFRVIESVTRDS
jgi:PAS domain S-box-containing protein